MHVDVVSDQRFVFVFAFKSYLLKYVCLNSLNIKLIPLKILRFIIRDSKTNQSYNVHEIFLKDKRKNLRTKVKLYSWKLFKQIKNFENYWKTREERGRFLKARKIYMIYLSSFRDMIKQRTFLENLWFANNILSTVHRAILS